MASECGNNGVCDGDHYCSTARGEPYCRPCSDIASHYCHNMTEVERMAPQCRYFCTVGATIRKLNQTLNEERTGKRERDEIPDVLGDPRVIAVAALLAALLAAALVAVVVFGILLWRERHKKPATAKEPEAQSLMALEAQSSDAGQEQAPELPEVKPGEVIKSDAVVAQASRQAATPSAPYQGRCDVGYETASSNASLSSAATDIGFPAPGVRVVNSAYSPSNSADRVPADNDQNEAGGRMQVSDAAACPGEAERSTIVNIPTTEDSRYARSLATSVSRHPGDDLQ